MPGRSTWRRSAANERPHRPPPRARRRRADPRLAQLGVDGHRAVSRGGRRVLVDRAERDRARAGALRARRRRARRRRPTSSRSTASRTSTAARRSSSCVASSGRGRSRGTGSTRRPTRSGSRRSRPPTTRRSPASRRRSTARRPTTACTRRCGSTACSRPTRGARGSTRRSTSCGRTRSACSTTSSAPSCVRRVAGAARTRAARTSSRSPRGVHEAELAELLGGDDDGAPLRTAGRRTMVTAEPTVWEALAEIPDPEIPVISLVDLGVVKDVAVDDGTRARRLHADVHGLPRARGDAARDGGEDRASSAREPEVGSCSTTRGRPTDITRRGPREAPRGRLRAARAARRPARSTLVQLQRGVPLPVLRLDRDAAREPLRPDPVPLDPLLRRAAASRSSSSRRCRAGRIRPG